MHLIDVYTSTVIWLHDIYLTVLEKKRLSPRFNDCSKIISTLYKLKEGTRCKAQEYIRPKPFTFRIRSVKFAIDLLHQTRQAVQDVAVRDNAKDLLSVEHGKVTYATISKHLSSVQNRHSWRNNKERLVSHLAYRHFAYVDLIGKQINDVRLSNYAKRLVFFKRRYYERVYSFLNHALCSIENKGARINRRHFFRHYVPDFKSLHTFHQCVVTQLCT